ncbi:MAG: efflux RND transporter periplasmic adaptor subunit [Thermoanaerobaculaceae bacterium]
MNKRIWLMLALVSAIAGCTREKDHFRAEGLSTSVRAGVGVAQRRERLQLQAVFGSVEAEKQTAVSSRVMATVVAVKVKPGDHVNKGQVLVEIDPQTAEGQVAQARGALVQAQAALALAERNFHRFNSLFAEKAASELELDLARMQYEQAKGAVEQARGALEAASSVAQESRVVAPFDGVVAAKLVEVGDLAAPGRPLLMLQSARGRRFVATIPESVFALLNPSLGQEAKVVLDSQPNQEILGKIAEISPAADPVTHSFTLKVDLEVKDLPSGLAGRLLLPLPSRTAVMVPKSAVMRVGGLTIVVVRDAEKKARSRVVTLGDGEGEFVEVLSGLTGGEEVLLGLSEPPMDGVVVEEG